MAGEQREASAGASGRIAGRRTGASRRLRPSDGSGNAIPQPMQEASTANRRKGCSLSLSAVLAYRNNIPSPDQCVGVWGCYFGFSLDIAWKQANTLFKIEQPPFCSRSTVCSRLRSGVATHMRRTCVVRRRMGAGGSRTPQDAPGGRSPCFAPWRSRRSRHGAHRASPAVPLPASESRKKEAFPCPAPTAPVWYLQQIPHLRHKRPSFRALAWCPDAVTP